MSKLGTGDYKTVNGYVNGKIRALTESNRTFEALYGFMFSERENIMAERSEGHRVVSTTYGECRDDIERLAERLKPLTSDIAYGAVVGLYMDNSLEWIKAFWAILECGFSPLLMNLRLDDDRLTAVLKENDVKLVISDGKKFDCAITLSYDDIANATETATDKSEWADEIIVMSSGTSEKVKLCVYSGENFVYQIRDSARIIAGSKQIKKHYRNRLKLLVFLPLYHIFGLAAMYMWFGFFSRTFVFLKDIRPETILYTIKRHKVTHIFAVPLFWNKVYNEFWKKIKERGEKTVEKCRKGLRIAKKTGSKTFSKLAFGEVRDNIFGDSVKFMITGGGAISPDVIAFFNAIGYHLTNGYGMSEVGITSVDLSRRPKKLNTGSVGKPFAHVNYSINENGELLVGGKSAATRIICGGEITELGGKPYNTHDLVKLHKGKYYMLGRRDDVIIGEDGENINPDYEESRISIAGAEEFCLLCLENGGAVKPTLLVRVNRYVSESRLKEIKHTAESELVRIGLAGTVGSVMFTSEPLVGEDEFKPNRRRIAERIANGSMSISVDTEVSAERFGDELYAKMRGLFAAALNKDESEITDNAHFFFDLAGTSLDYFTLINSVRNEFGVEFPVSDKGSLSTVSEFCDFIRK